MANFTFTWNNGSVTSVPLPSETGFSCDYTSPSSAMNSAANQIVLHAEDGDNPHETEQYCADGQAAILGLYQASKQIYDKWDELEIDCAGWNNWVRWCSEKSRYCSMSENELESAYYSWRPIVNSNLANLSNIEEIWQDASNQIELDGQQATNQAILDQLIATTNEEISLVAYQNEVREIDASVTKTNKIFMPLIIGIVIIGLGFYFYKK